MWEIQANRASGGVLSEHDVDGEILHRRVQHLLDLTVQAVDLIDEKHITLGKSVQNRGDLARLLDRRSRGHLDIHPELVRNDVTDGRLTESRRAVKQAVIQGLSAILRRLNIDLQHLLQLTLADVVIERLRTNLRLQLPILYRLICIDYSTFQICTSLRAIARILSINTPVSSTHMLHTQLYASRSASGLFLRQPLHQRQRKFKFFRLAFRI